MLLVLLAFLSCKKGGLEITASPATVYIGDTLALQLEVSGDIEFISYNLPGLVHSDKIEISDVSEGTLDLSMGGLPNTGSLNEFISATEFSIVFRGRSEKG